MLACQEQRGILVTDDGDEWFARYSFRQWLAQGGMGVIYLAQDKARNNAPCVLKQLAIVDATPEEHEEAVRFFKREVDILRRLSHPGIVQLFDYHVTNDHKCFLVMDYVPGTNLEKMIKTSGPFASEAVVEIGIQCCQILEYLHQHEPPIIYRDLKPSNLMLTPEGQIVFIDFGIARTLVPQQVATRVVTTGYSPPEQYFGRPEPRSDLYALGATLGNLLTGVRPKPVSVSSPAKLKRDVIPSLDSLISILTAHSPDDRPDSASEVKLQLYHIYRELHPEFVVPEQRNVEPNRKDRKTVGTQEAQGNSARQLAQIDKLLKENMAVGNHRLKKLGHNIKGEQTEQGEQPSATNKPIIWQSIRRFLNMLKS
jgi:serine/threonine protein kinase